MASVVTSLWDAGVRDMSMIHDSYAVHACNVPLMRQTILENFVEIHRVPLLDVLYEEVIQQLESPVPPPPEYGDYNIEDTLEAEYAFH
jgi:DNA-directed RNA polymerase